MKIENKNEQKAILKSIYWRGAYFKARHQNKEALFYENLYQKVKSQYILEHGTIGVEV